MPASGSTVRAPDSGGSALGAWVGAALGDPVGAGQACASGGRPSVGPAALLRNGAPPDDNVRARITASPIARIAPATPEKISICRRRRCGPLGCGDLGRAGGGVDGGTLGAVTVPDPHGAPGRCQ